MEEEIDVDTRVDNIVFTRKDLQELRVAMVKKEREDAVRKLAAQVRGGVLNAAMHTEKKSYAQYVGIMPHIPMFSESYNRVIEDTLYSLSRTFPDVAIVYRKARNDIYVEWA